MNVLRARLFSAMRSEEGMSLIEVVIAIVILAIPGSWFAYQVWITNS